MGLSCRVLRHDNETTAATPNVRASNSCLSLAPGSVPASCLVAVVSELLRWKLRILQGLGVSDMTRKSHLQSQVY